MLRNNIPSAFNIEHFLYFHVFCKCFLVVRFLFLSIRFTHHNNDYSNLFTDAHNGAKGSPLTVVGLYPNEQKMSVLNFTVRRHHLFSDPVKSKERLIIQCGFRRFECNPIFSDHSNLDKHKVTITK